MAFFQTKGLPFDMKTLKQVLGFFTIMLIACKLTSSIAYIVTLPIALWALSTKNTVWTFTMLLYMSLSLCTNTFFIPKTTILVQMQRMEMMLIGGITMMTIFGQKKALFLSPFLGMFFYILYMAGVSGQGWAPIVSYMKLAIFVPIFFGFYGMAARVYVDERDNIDKIRSVVLAYCIYMMVYSVLVWPFPAISQLHAEDMTAAEMANQMANISLFKGMTQHSQLLGVLAGFIGVVVLGDYIFSVRRHFWIYDLILVCTIFCVFKSSSRTGMASMIAGWGVLAICFIKARGLRRSWKGKVIQFGTMTIAILTISVLMIGPVRERVLGFVLKYGGNNAQAVKQMTKEDILMSRQGKLDAAIENWRQSPMFGNGFQVSENMKYIRNFKELLTAPVEKSTWIYAILEEGGVVGEIIFVLWALTVIILLAKRHAYIGLASFVCFLMINMGEFVIFSLSYSGAAFWSLTFAGCLMDSQRYKLQRIIEFRNRQELIAMEMEMMMRQV